MDKIADINLLPQYDRQNMNMILNNIKKSINQGVDGYLFPVKAITTSYTQSLNDGLILADATAGAITVTLQPALNCTQKRIVIKKIDSTFNIIKIDANSTETIDGSLTKTLYFLYESYELMPYNGNWYII